MAKEHQTEITTEKLLGIIGMKEVEIVTLREQVAFLLHSNAELVAAQEQKTEQNDEIEG